MTVNCSYVPLLTAASRAADELSIAAVTRGIENPKERTCTRILHLADGGIREDLTMVEGSLPTIKGLFGVQ